MKCRCALVFILLLIASAARPDDAGLKAALAKCRQPGDARREGHCSFLSGLADLEAGKADAARLHLEEAGRRLEAAGDPVAAWKALWALAEYEHRFGRRPDLRVATFEKALAVVERAKRSNAPFPLDGLAELRDILHRSSQAPGGTGSLAIRFFEAVSRDGYAAALLDAGELEKAETQLGIAAEVAGPFGAMLDRSISRNVGHLRRRQWRLDEARESYQKALAMPKTRRPFTVDDRQEGDVAALHGLAEIEVLSGRTDEALGWNDRALVLARGAGEHGAELSLLSQRAAILEGGGRFAAAEDVYARAVSVAETKGDVKGHATLLSNRASMYMDIGRYGAAIADGEKALELLAAIDDPVAEAALLAHVAGLYFNLAAHDGAASALEQARALVSKKNGSRLGKALLDVVTAGHTGTPADLNKSLDHFLQLPEVRGMPNVQQLATLLRATVGPTPAADLNAVDRRDVLLGEGFAELPGIMLLIDQSRFSAAREAAVRALALNPKAELRALLLTVVALAYAGEGEVKQSLDYSMKALDAFDAAMDDLLVDDLMSGFLGEKRTLYFDMLIELFVLTNRAEEAFAVAECARARAFLQLVGNRRIRAPSGEGRRIARETEALRKQIAQWQQQARIAPSKELETDLRGARRRYAGLRTRVKASDPEYAALTSIESAPLEAIRKELPPATTLISYFVSGGRAHAWVLDRTTIEHVPLPVNDAWLESAMCAVRQLGRGGRGVRVLRTRCEPAAAEELYERLFAPLRAHIRNSRLIFVPHLRLHYLPFGAFRDPRTKRYLIEDYTITHAPSASSIRFLRDKETPVKGKALVIGAPAGVTPDLPGALREAKMVAAELRTAPMVGASAKESLLYQLNGEVDLVHVAAHGFYEPDTPLFSRLALAGGNGSDGDLQVHEILSDVDLSGVNLVVLSACQTAVGTGSAGDDVVGLTRALLYAGTPGVISTLWDIGDDAAAVLMRHFYDRLLRGDSAADALRHAQLQLLHGDYPDPRQWAAFTLTGDPQGRWGPPQHGPQNRDAPAVDRPMEHDGPAASGSRPPDARCQDGDGPFQDVSTVRPFARLPIHNSPAPTRQARGHTSNE